MNSNNFIDISSDNYYINPYKFKYTDNNLLLLNNNDSENNLNIIIKTLTSIIMSNGEINNNNLSPDYNLIQNNKINIFKLVANNQINELKKYLNHNNKNINEQDNDGDTPLHIAVFLSNYDVCNILVTSGANIFIKDKWGQIPLHRICFTLKNKNTLKIIDLMLEYQQNKNIFNTVDKFNNTPLHLVIKYILKNNIHLNKNILSVINKLLESTNLDLTNDDGLSLNDLIKMLNLS